MREFTLTVKPLRSEDGFWAVIKPHAAPNRLTGYNGKTEAGAIHNVVKRFFEYEAEIAEAEAARRASIEEAVRLVTAAGYTVKTPQDIVQDEAARVDREHLKVRGVPWTDGIDGDRVEVPGEDILNVLGNLRTNTTEDRALRERVARDMREFPDNTAATGVLVSDLIVETRHDMPFDPGKRGGAGDRGMTGE